MSKEAIIAALSIATVWYLIEIFERPPRGFHGARWLVFFSYFVLVAAVIMMFINMAIWVLTWSTYVKT